MSQGDSNLTGISYSDLDIMPVREFKSHLNRYIKYLDDKKQQEKNR